MVFIIFTWCECFYSGSSFHAWKSSVHVCQGFNPGVSMW